MKPSFRLVDQRIDHRPNTPIGLKRAHTCSYCGIECRPGKQMHHRCRVEKERHEREQADLPLAEHIARVAGEYVARALGVGR